MRRPVLFLALLLLFVTTPAFGQVFIDASTSSGRGVNATTVRLTGTLLTPLPGLPAGPYTVDFQWDPSLVCLEPVAIVTGPNGPFLPNLTGTYAVSLTSTQFGCANPAFNITASASGTMRLTQRGDSLTGFGGVFFPATGAIDGVGVEAVVSPGSATGQLQLLSTLGLLGIGTVSSTIAGSTLNLSFTGSTPAIGCQFTGSGVASKVAP